MKLELSDRIRKCAELVTEGSRLADVGTDHAYLPVFLVTEGKIPRAIAMDINAGPLARAREHIAAFALEDRIEARLSDGLHELRAGEADCVSVCGMGGALTIRILEEGFGVLGSVQELVLQPQSEIFRVRVWLSEHDLRIDNEEMVLEEGKYYPIIHCVHREAGNGRPLTDAEIHYGPVLLKKKHPVLRQFLRYEQEVQEKILEQLSNAGAQAAMQRKEEVRAVLRRNREALDIMGEEAAE